MKMVCDEYFADSSELTGDVLATILRDGRVRPCISGHEVRRIVASLGRLNVFFELAKPSDLIGEDK